MKYEHKIRQIWKLTNNINETEVLIAKEKNISMTHLTK